MKDFLAINDLNAEVLQELIEQAIEIKKEFKAGVLHKQLEGKILAMIFDKPSTRTRVSFEAGMLQTGGNAMLLNSGSIGLGKRESVADVARTLSRMVDGLVIRTFSHELVTELAENAQIPVINGLTDWSHPCQAMADVMTIREVSGRTRGVKLTYIGDGNNVARSLAQACYLSGIELTICAPKNYQLEQELLTNLDIKTETDPFQAVKEADFIYTDVWASMGQEAESVKREKAFQEYQLNQKLLKTASSSCMVMHCLPAHRGKEITDEVIDSSQSIVFDQAENRLHAQKAILIRLMA